MHTGDDHPAHSVPSRITTATGIAAALTGVGLGTAALIGAPQPVTSGPDTLQHITATSPPLPLSAQEILALLEREPDFGQLDDPRRRASCLTGLGYPASTRVLGVRPVEIDGRSAVLLVLPGGQADTVLALAVRPSCSSADTGLLGDTVVRRP